MRKRASSPSPSPTHEKTLDVPKRKQESVDIIAEQSKKSEGRDDVPMKRSGLNLIDSGRASESDQKKRGSSGSNFLVDEASLLRRFEKYTIFWGCKDNPEKTYEIVVELPTDCTVADCIVAAVPLLNEVLKFHKCSYLLRNDANLYEMYYAKKNGKPKPDYPPFFNEQVLSKSHIKLITLQEKGPEALVKPSMSLLVPQAVVQERTASSKATQMKEPPKIRSERPSAAEKTLFTGSKHLRNTLIMQSTLTEMNTAQFSILFYRSFSVFRVLTPSEVTHEPSLKQQIHC
eukprot:TRINITY_DN2740_c0_g2_i1.p1 TRINITY_DN2740_c0_g2~~TRINITY_DN2740_c0_g2_i1.p1  ORF type:complete len:288 (-),score=36.69 TRINITY_DN2740_c0_g2_i1:117-980(-)